MKSTDDIGLIKNVGKERKSCLNRLGIFTVGDLISHYPRSYLDRSDITEIRQAICEDFGKNPISVKIKVKDCKLAATPQKSVVTVKIYDDTGEMEAVWFNQPYMKNHFVMGKEYILTGVINKKFKPQMESPDIEALDSKELLSSCRIVPVYPLVSGLSQKVFRGIIHSALSEISDEDEFFKELFPERFLADYDIINKKEAVKNIHFPETNEFFLKARKRLVFDELIITRTALIKLKGYIKKKNDTIIEPLSETEISNLVPFELTNAQKKVLSEIMRDLGSGFTMNRLIQGDVGSGKTAVAVLACYAVIKQGDSQAAIMAPTEVLARQHYSSIKKMLDSVGVKTVLLSGKMKAREKAVIREDIKENRVQMIIGTHALIQEMVEFSNLALVIVDEQHRFGVRQRSSLALKGVNPHMAVMTATPIPRTLGLILYGDMDISIIDEMPPGRIKIETYGVTPSYRQRIFSFLKKEIESGRQVYIVCPMIEENEQFEYKSVLKYTREISEGFFSDFKVAYLHGKMKNDEKNDVMERFSKGELDILVSTTVIEVGINVPNATVMLIEDSDRFGLSQLHQLRGRVGRGALKSYCILVSGSKSKIAKERMKVMSSTNDGFEIAELDLKLRGYGDFFGTAQHGLPDMKIANLYRDMDILNAVNDAAEKINDNSEFLLFNKEVDKLVSLFDNSSL